MNQTIFVLMPFKADLDEIYKDTVKPVVEKLGLNCIRADEQVGPSQIMGDIWRFIKNGELFIADLTGINPNVFYELGLAHAQNKIVILLTQNINDVPFDLRHLRVIEYKNTKAGRVDLENILTQTLESIVNQLEKPEIRNKYIIFDTSESIDTIQEITKTVFELAMDVASIELIEVDIWILLNNKPQEYSDNFNAKINEKLKILNIPYPMPGWINFLEGDERKKVRNIWIKKISDEIKKNEKYLKIFEFGHSWYILTRPSFWINRSKKDIENFVVPALYNQAPLCGVSESLIQRMKNRFNRYIKNEYPQNTEGISRYFSKLKNEILENLASSR